MELITAARHGWQALRIKTFRRDRGCVAVQERIMGPLAAVDSCRSGPSLAAPTIERWALDKMEWDHIREQIGGRRLDDEAHGITVCPWHHRGSGERIDTSDRRAKVREYLAALYPDQWAGVPLAGS